MHLDAIGILFTALFIIPICLGLWRDGRTDRQGGLKPLLERRRNDRRMKKRPMHDPRANYHYLGSLHPAQSKLNAKAESSGRRSGERGIGSWRFEDTAYQSAPLLSRHAGVRVFSPRNMPNEIAQHMPAMEATRLRVEHTSPANFLETSDSA